MARPCPNSVVRICLLVLVFYIGIGRTHDVVPSLEHLLHREIQTLKEKLDDMEAKQDTLEAATEQFRLKAKSMKNLLQQERAQYDNLVSKTQNVERQLKEKIESLLENINESEARAASIQSWLEHAIRYEKEKESEYEKAINRQKDEIFRLEQAWRGSLERTEFLERVVSQRDNELEEANRISSQLIGKLSGAHEQLNQMERRFAIVMGNIYSLNQLHSMYKDKIRKQREELDEFEKRVNSASAENESLRNNVQQLNGDLEREKNYSSDLLHEITVTKEKLQEAEKRFGEQLTSASSENESLHSVVRQLRDDLEEERTASFNLRHEITFTKERLQETEKEFERQITAASFETESLRSNIGQLHEDLAEESNENESLRRIIQQLNDHLKEEKTSSFNLLQEVMTTKEKLLHMEIQFEKRMSTALVENENLRSTIKHLNGYLEEESTDNANLKATLQKVKEDLDLEKLSSFNLLQDVKSLRSTLEQLYEDLAEEKAKTENLQSTIDQLNHDLVEEKSTSLNFLEEVRNLRMNIEQLRDDLENETTENLSLRNTIQELTHDLEQEQTENEGLRHTVQQLGVTQEEDRRTIKELSDALDTDRSTIKELNENVENDRRTIQELNDSLNEGHSIIKQLSEDLEKDRSTIKQLSDALEKETNENESLRSRVEHLSDSVKQLDNDLEDERNVSYNLFQEVLLTKQRFQELEIQVEKRLGSSSAENDSLRNTIQKLYGSLDDETIEKESLRSTIKQLNDYLAEEKSVSHKLRQEINVTKERLRDIEIQSNRLTLWYVYWTRIRDSDEVAATREILKECWRYTIQVFIPLLKTKSVESVVFMRENAPKLYEQAMKSLDNTSEAVGDVIGEENKAWIWKLLNPLVVLNQKRQVWVAKSLDLALSFNQMFYHGFTSFQRIMEKTLAAAALKKLFRLYQAIHQIFVLSLEGVADLIAVFYTTKGCSFVKDHSGTMVSLLEVLVALLCIDFALSSVIAWFRGNRSTGSPPRTSLLRTSKGAKSSLGAKVQKKHTDIATVVTQKIKL